MRERLMGNERVYLVHIAAATLLVFLAGVLSAITVPFFGGPDEKNHYNSVVRVVDGGGWPLPYTARVMPAVDLAWLESGRASASAPDFDQVPLAVNRSSVLEEPNFALLSAEIDNMVQHPPAYYFLTASVVAMTDLDSLRWDQAMLVMRIFSAFLVSLSVPAIAGIVRLVTGSRSLGAVGAYALLAIPFFTGFGGLVSNDTLLVPTISGALYFLIRAWKSNTRTTFLLVAAGILLGVSLLTKGFALFAIPLFVFLSFVAVFSKKPTKMRGTVIALIAPSIAALIGGWWWIRNLILLGSVQPSVSGTLRVALDEPLSNINVLSYFGNFWLRFNSLFWARGVRPVDGGNELPAVLLGVAGVAFVVAFVVVALYSRNRGMTFLLLSFPAIIIAVLFANSLSVYETYGVADRGVQGRYVFAGIAAYSLIVAGFVGILGRKLTPRNRNRLFVGVVASSAAIAWANIAWLLISSWPNGYSEQVPGLEAVSGYFGVSLLVYVALTGSALAVLIGAYIAHSKLSQPEGFASDLTDLAPIQSSNAPTQRGTTEK
ncbi:putative membrane protein DUF2142 [Salinibacterium amurskyense]|uniref:Putative membrane protein DUF2142 n=2 Tax=Salinibacterium amurskyense TaxID=205941 RepID=A0A2M9D979_9MICO|nr:DUF2142 domain-containing protein [Salinibacterium amurskyense]PJJ82158.1 putative membrane protein DUF2142 [Salinibacterium amurskyense]